MATKSPSAWSLIKQTIADFNQDNAMRLAAAMACYIMLALAPMIVIAFKVLYWVYGENTDKVIQAQTGQLIGPAGADAIGQMIENASKSGGGTLATVVSLVIVLFSASGVFVSLQDALNTIWEVKPRPNAGWWQWFRKRFLSMGMVLGVAILLLTSMVVTSVLHVIVDAVFGADRTGFLANAAAYATDFLVTVAVAWAVFMAVFKYLPDVKIAWRDVWVGALVTAVLFKIGQIAMAIYFNYGSATSAYGTFGSIVAVLLWAYYSSIIMFLGAEFTQVWATAHGRELEPEPHAMRVTEAERAQQGIPNKDRLAAQSPCPPQQRPRPIVVHDRGTGTSYAYGAVGAAIGAVAAVLAANYAKQNRREAAGHLQERLNAIEAKVGRVSVLKPYLEKLNVADRIDRVEREIVRAGTHIRAEETGRPRWMVRVADVIGGRWSNL